MPHGGGRDCHGRLAIERDIEPRGSRAAFRIGCCVLEIVVKMLATHVIVG